MSTDITTDGYPFPLGDDPVMEGDDRIKELAEALTGRTYTRLGNDAIAAVAAPSEWPIGVSFHAVAAAPGWPRTAGTVVTQRFFSDRALQLFYARGASAMVYARTAVSASAWSPWAGLAGPSARAVGTVAITPTGANTTTNATVTLPAGLFTAQPRIQLTPNVGSPNTVWLSYLSPSPTSFIASMYRTTTPAVTISWDAAQEDQPAAPALLAAGPTAEPDATVTCPTDGCGNYGAAIEVPTHFLDDEGTSHAVDVVLCGVCGATLTPTSKEA